MTSAVYTNNVQSHTFPLGGQIALTEKETFGQWLKRTREAKGMIPAELARRSGLSRNYIYQLENDYSPAAADRKARPRQAKVDAIANALGVSLTEARTAAGYMSPDKTLESAKAKQAAEFVDALPDERQDDALLILQALYSKHAKRRKTAPLVDSRPRRPKNR